MSTMSATPRTDSAIFEEDTGINGMVEVVSPDFARNLERENARLRAALESIASMPEHDQDDAHRMRHLALVAILYPLAPPPFK